MHIEETIFKKSNVIIPKLISYGFVKKDNAYFYSKTILNNTFRIDIRVDATGKVKGKIIELANNQEYTNFRVQDNTGEFVNSIKLAFENTLLAIKKNCFSENYFLSDQANRITSLIIKKYNDLPLFAWNSYPGYGIFKNLANDKWYALIMNISKDKLVASSPKEEVEIINLKLAPEKILNLLTKKGFYKVYHMNKTNWLSIILDDTLSDEEIMTYLEESHHYTEKK
jgi:predicted DNA-binding protein (MmcQ/YjbR family)